MARIIEWQTPTHMGAHIQKHQAPWLRHWGQLGCQGQCIIWGSQLSVGCPDVAVLTALRKPSAPGGLDQIWHTHTHTHTHTYTVTGKSLPHSLSRNKHVPSNRLTGSLMQQFPFHLPVRIINVASDKMICTFLTAVSVFFETSFLMNNIAVSWSEISFFVST